jgi:hypothetical protein
MAREIAGITEVISIELDVQYQLLKRKDCKSAGIVALVQSDREYFWLARSFAFCA